MYNKTTVHYHAIGDRLYQRRRELHMTQSELASKVGVSTSFIGHLERAEKIPSLETVVRICAVLNMTLDELVLGRKNMCAGKTCALYEQLSEMLKLYGMATQHQPPAR